VTGTEIDDYDYGFRIFPVVQELANCLGIRMTSHSAVQISPWGVHM